jgi:hypothetical protein
MAPDALPANGMDDLFWDGLLLQIEERRVVPVVGPDLLVVQTEQGAKPLYRWAAERLAEVLRVPTI